MKKKIEQILSGKFEYDQPELLFSKEKLEIKIQAGTTMQGELYLGTENNDKIQGYVTSSDRRFVPGNSRFSGTTIRLPYGIDAVGMQPGDVCRGWLCVTSGIGEYKLPFVIEAVGEELVSSIGKVDNIEAFCDIAKRDFREAYHLFCEQDFCEILKESDRKQKALYAGLSRQPVTYQHLEEFLIGLKEKEPVSISLKTTAAEFYNVEENMQESFEIHRSGWGHLRLEIETRGEFLEPQRHVVTDEDFIGSSVQIDYLVHADKLEKENHIGEVIVRSPYQELRYHVLASRSSRIHIDVNREEKRHKLALVKDYLEYQEGRTDFQTWKENSGYELNQLKESGCDYPEYQFLEAYMAHLDGKDDVAKKILKNYHGKEFTRDELETAGISVP